MADIVSLASLAISAGAVAIAYRSDRRSGRAFKIAEEEHRQRLLDRQARAELGVEMSPSNVRPDDDGVIRTEATTIYVNLAITVTNQGTKPAGRTQLDAWVPTVVNSSTLKWVDPSGAELDRFGTSAPDPAVKLDTGDGRTFDAQRMARTLESVPLIGETLYLRIPCPIGVGAEGRIPVRVRVRSDDSEADVTYPIRLQHTKAAF